MIFFRNYAKGFHHFHRYVCQCLIKGNCNIPNASKKKTLFI